MNTSVFAAVLVLMLFGALILKVNYENRPGNRFERSLGSSDAYAEHSYEVLWQGTVNDIPLTIVNPWHGYSRDSQYWFIVPLDQDFRFWMVRNSILWNGYATFIGWFHGMTAVEFNGSLRNELVLASDSMAASRVLNTMNQKESISRLLEPFCQLYNNKSHSKLIARVSKTTLEEMSLEETARNLTEVASLLSKERNNIPQS